MKKSLFRENRNNKNVWQIQEAKAKFSQLVEDANIKGYQTITKQGEPVAVILSKKNLIKLLNLKLLFLIFLKLRLVKRSN